MPLEPYQYRPATPPKTATPSPEIPQGGHSRNASGSPIWSSTESAATCATTPNLSPLRHCGPALLPRIRTRDQCLEPENVTTHRRAQSHDITSGSLGPSARPPFQRSTTTPPVNSSVLTPISANSNFGYWNDSAVNSPAAFPSSHGRRNLGHTRSTSTSALDFTALRRYAYPSRNLPVYMEQAPQYAPAMVPGLADFVSAPPVAQPHPLYRELTPELLVETGAEPTNTISAYFTEPNPALHILPKDSSVIGNGSVTNCWWDVRNVRTWEDLNLKTIMDIPGFPELLNINVNAAALSNPQLGSNYHIPANVTALHDTCTRFYAHKVNEALRLCQGQERHAIMLPGCPKAEGPNFISNYANDIEATLSGNGRSRVVGLVKPYEVWNSAFRHDKPRKQVLYLAGLAHLQRLMRDHGCRYGFIMSEIELVCVRMGTEERVPYFGLLELAKPVRMEDQEGLTACLALWYLHMLTSDVPLTGQCGWKVHVGLPVEMTRSHIVGDRDAWMPKQTVGEMRNPRRIRGWVSPTDPFCKRKEVVVKK